MQRITLLTISLSLLFSAIAYGQCTPSATVLCFQDSRFSAEVSWQDGAGMNGVGQAVPLAVSDTGIFWFTEDIYVEIFMKVLNGCALNGHFWVFFGSLTDFEYTLTVTDTDTSTVRAYTNSLGQRSVVTDTTAFATCPTPPPVGKAHSTSNDKVPVPRQDIVSETYPETVQGGPCTPDATTLCLAGNRFQIQVAWRNFDDTTGDGQTFPVTSHSGGFWFFSPNNIELMIKIVETCEFFEVHFAALTNVEYTVTVSDTETGEIREWFNPLGVASPGVGDLTAFDAPCLIFGDDFESGDTSSWSSSMP